MHVGSSPLSGMGFVGIMSPYGETGGLRLDKNGSSRLLWEPTAPPPHPPYVLKIACPIRTPGTQSTTHRSPHLRGCPPGTWSWVWSWEGNQAHCDVPGDGDNWALTWLDCAGVCKRAGPCVEGFGDTVMSQGGHGGTTQRAPGKPGPHLTLPDPRVSLPQSPAGS